MAVVPAAGSGQRLGAGIAKAFVTIGERPMLELTLDGLWESGVVDSVVLVVPADRTDEAKLLFGGDAVVVVGGADRTESVGNGLAAVGDAEFVLVHDAARALTPPALIVRVVEALRAGHPAVVPAVPLADTVKAVDAAGTVIGTPDRAGLRAVQTPQGFRADLLRRAYAEAGGTFTDDAAMVESIGAGVHVVAGDPRAFKITTPMDLLLAEAVLAAARGTS